VGILPTRKNWPTEKQLLLVKGITLEKPLPSLGAPRKNISKRKINKTPNWTKRKNSKGTHQANALKANALASI